MHSLSVAIFDKPLRLTFAFLMGCLLVPGVFAQRPPPQAQTATQIFLPQMVAPRNEPFSQANALWVSTPVANNNAIGLFRYRLDLDQIALGASLEIFADTRYEAYLNGRLVGRGPARFDRAIREYDRLSLGNLPPGAHQLAVLVHWAPNNRRSESQWPQLIARVVDFDGRVVRDPKPSEWRSLLSTAWNEQASQVHVDYLLGPTELLDTRHLPANWHALDFDDQAWPPALPSLPVTASYRPRSIALLAQEPIQLALASHGPLLPDDYLSELLLEPGRVGEYRFRLSESANVTLRTLFSPGILDPAVITRLNGQPLTWQRDPRLPPDLRQTTIALPAGEHRLQVIGTPATIRWPFTISKRGLEAAPPPPSQGDHAGRRLLLSVAGSYHETTPIEGTSLNLSFEAAPSYLIVDLGRTVQGRLSVEVEGPRGALVDAGWDERLWSGDWPLPYPGSLHEAWNQTDSWILRGETQTLSTLDTRAGRYLYLAFWGEGPITIRNLRVIEERYPTILRGSYQSDNPRIDRIWQIGVDTLYSNMHDAYADAWRERGQWWGDAYVADHVAQVAFGDPTLLRRGIILMGNTIEPNGRPAVIAPNGLGNHMVDYGMLWIQSIHDYHRLTADTQTIRQLLPAVERFFTYVERFRDSETGLIKLPEGHWRDTSYIDSYSYLDRNGISTAVNSLYYGTLLQAGELADALDQRQLAQTWRLRADEVRTAINSHLFRDGTYISSLFNGVANPPTSQGLAYALAYGVVPKDQEAAVVTALLEAIGPPELPRLNVYGMYWALEGLGRAGYTAEGLDLVNRYFGRLVDRGARTWWENFNSISDYQSSLSHGWGGGPTWFLSRHVLGLQQTNPSEWRVTPALELARHAQGSIPIGEGVLGVAWGERACGQRLLTVEAPEHTSGHLEIALDGTFSAIDLSGAPLWRNGALVASTTAHLSADGQRLTVPLASGTHQLLLEHSGSCR